jgi:hypothetical protein
MTALHQLDLSNLDTTTELITLNNETTKGSDLLLSIPINDAVCADVSTSNV